MENRKTGASAIEATESIEPAGSLARREANSERSAEEFLIVILEHGARWTEEVTRLVVGSAQSIVIAQRPGESRRSFTHRAQARVAREKGSLGCLVCVMPRDGALACKPPTLATELGVGADILVMNIVSDRAHMMATWNEESLRRSPAAGALEIADLLVADRDFSGVAASSNEDVAELQDACVDADGQGKALSGVRWRRPSPDLGQAPTDGRAGQGRCG